MITWVNHALEIALDLSLGRGLGRGRAGRRTAADRADRDGPDGRPGSGRGGILRGHGDEGSLVFGSWVWFGSWGVLYAARGFRGGNQIVPRPQLLAFGPCDVLPCLSLSLSLSLSAFRLRRCSRSRQGVGWSGGCSEYSASVSLSGNCVCERLGERKLGMTPPVRFLHARGRWPSLPASPYRS